MSASTEPAEATAISPATLLEKLVPQMPCQELAKLMVSNGTMQSLLSSNLSAAHFQPLVHRFEISTMVFLLSALLLQGEGSIEMESTEVHWEKGTLRVKTSTPGGYAVVEQLITPLTEKTVLPMLQLLQKSFEAPGAKATLVMRRTWNMPYPALSYLFAQQNVTFTAPTARSTSAARLMVVARARVFSPRFRSLLENKEKNVEALQGINQLITTSFPSIVSARYLMRCSVLYQHVNTLVQRQVAPKKQTPTS